MSNQIEISELYKQIDRKSCDTRIHSGPIRKKTYKNGAEHFVRQCLKCGAQIGNPIKAKSEEIISLDGNIELFDITIEEQYSSDIKKIRDAISKLNEIDRKPLHIKKVKTVKEIHREDLEKSIDLLFNKIETREDAKFVEGKLLQRLRKHINIHDKFDENKDFSSELEIEAWLSAFLSIDFHVYTQVPGRHLAEGVGVKIDCLLYPKPHLIEAGFVESFVGVENKNFHPDNKFCRLSSRSWWQAVSYLDCEFYLDDEVIRPKFCLLFSNLSFEGELDYLKRYYGTYDNDVIMWWSYQHLANHANVGNLIIKGSPQNNRGWAMRFAGTDYFHTYEWDGNRRYSTPKPDIINKVRIGNF